MLCRRLIFNFYFVHTQIIGRLLNTLNSIHTNNNNNIEVHQVWSKWERPNLIKLKNLNFNGDDDDKFLRMSEISFVIIFRFIFIYLESLYVVIVGSWPFLAQVLIKKNNYTWEKESFHLKISHFLVIDKIKIKIKFIINYKKMKNATKCHIE